MAANPSVNTEISRHSNSLWVAKQAITTGGLIFQERSREPFTSSDRPINHSIRHWPRSLSQGTETKTVSQIEFCVTTCKQQGVALSTQTGYLLGKADLCVYFLYNKQRANALVDRPSWNTQQQICTKCIIYSTRRLRSAKKPQGLVHSPISPLSARLPPH